MLFKVPTKTVLPFVTYWKNQMSQDIRKKILDLHKIGSYLGIISICLKVLRSQSEENKL